MLPCGSITRGIQQAETAGNGRNRQREDPMKTLEERIAQLEETIYFQDQTIRQLNEAITAQQFQMDEMEKMFIAMRAKLRTLAPLLDEGGTDDGPPPHYGSV